MARKKTENWFEKQVNPLTRRITWYWFVEPETPKTISSKLNPKYANKVRKNKHGHIEPFVSPSVSSHKNKADQVGYKDYTPKHYFSIVKKEKDIKYDKDKLYLNLNFLFDYLKDKIKLEEEDKEIFKLLFDDWKIRKFLFEWNKYKNEELSYQKITINKEVFDFEREVIDAILTFLRCIYLYNEFDLFISVFNNRIAKEYLNIAQIVKDFRVPKTRTGKIDAERAFKHARFFNKIEGIFPRKFSLEYKNSSIDLEHPRDIDEKKIWIYLTKSKRYRIESLLLYPYPAKKNKHSSS